MPGHRETSRAGPRNGAAGWDGALFAAGRRPIRYGSSRRGVGGRPGSVRCQGLRGQGVSPSRLPPPPPGFRESASGRAVVAQPSAALPTACPGNSSPSPWPNSRLGLWPGGLASAAACATGRVTGQGSRVSPQRKVSHVPAATYTRGVRGTSGVSGVGVPGCCWQSRGCPLPWPLVTPAPRVSPGPRG